MQKTAAQGDLRELAEAVRASSEENSFYLSEIHETTEQGFSDTARIATSGISRTVSRTENPEDQQVFVVEKLDELRKAAESLQLSNGGAWNEFVEQISEIRDTMSENHRQFLDSLLVGSSEMQVIDRFASELGKEIRESIKDIVDVSAFSGSLIQSAEPEDKRVEHIQDLSTNPFSSVDLVDSFGSYDQKQSRVNVSFENDIQDVMVENRVALKDCITDMTDSIRDDDTSSEFVDQQSDLSIIDRIEEALREQDGVRQSVEEKREESQLQKDLIQAVEGLQTGISETVSAGAKVAGIGALISLFMAPELFAKVIKDAVGVLSEALNAVSDLIQGSTKGLMDFVENNPFVSFLGASVALFGVVKLATSVIGSVMVAFNGFMSAFTAISGVLGAVSSALGIGMLPLLGTIALVGIAVKSLISGFSDAISVFEETGSLWKGAQTLFTSTVSNFLGTILDIPRWLLAKVTGMLGFDEISAYLDSFSFVDMFKDMFDMIGQIPKKITEYLSNVPLIGSFFESKEQTQQKQTRKQVLDQAKKDGVIDPEFFGNSEIDRTKLEDSSLETVREILKEYGSDLSKEDLQFTKDLLDKKTSTKEVLVKGNLRKTAADFTEARRVERFTASTEEQEQRILDRERVESNSTTSSLERATMEVSQIRESVNSQIRESQTSTTVAPNQTLQTAKLIENQVENKALRSVDETNNSQRVLNAVNNAATRIANNTSSSVTNINNGPGIDDILKDSLYNPV